MRRFLILANPIAGGGRAKTAAPRLREALCELGCEASLFFTSGADDARGRAGDIEPGEFEGVVAVGGDGTLNDVLNGLRDPSQPLAQLPMGTANVLAKELRLPRQPDKLAQLLTTSTPVELAIGRANGRRFLLFSSCGLDASIVERLEQVRTGTLGKLRWTGPILHTIRRWPEGRVRVTIGEQTLAAEPSTVIVTRVANYGGILKLPGGIAPGDGQLHVLVFPQQGRWRWFRAVLRALAGRLRVGKDVLHVPTTATIKIEQTSAGEIPYQVDGDLGGHLPLEIRLNAKPARFFAPLV